MIRRSLLAITAAAALAGCGSSGGDSASAPTIPVPPGAEVPTAVPARPSPLLKLALGGGRLPGFAQHGDAVPTTNAQQWANLTDGDGARLLRAGWVAGAFVGLPPAADARVMRFKTARDAQAAVRHNIGFPPDTRTSPAGRIPGGLFARTSVGNFILSAKGDYAFAVGGSALTKKQLLPAAEKQYRAAP